MLAKLVSHSPGNFFDRLVYVAAHNGHMPKVLAMVHNTRNTPMPSIIFLVRDSVFFRLKWNLFKRKQRTFDITELPRVQPTGSFLTLFNLSPLHSMLTKKNKRN